MECIYYSSFTFISFYISFEICRPFFKRRGICDKNENGEVNVSIESIKSIIREILNRDKDVRNPKIICGRKGRKHSCYNLYGHGN